MDRGGRFATTGVGSGGELHKLGVNGKILWEDLNGSYPEIFIA